VDGTPLLAKGAHWSFAYGRFRARRLIGDGTTEREENKESISGLTGVWAVVWRPGDDGEEVVVEAVGAGSTWAWREENEHVERCGGGQ
jgi:hypothetical protein